MADPREIRIEDYNYFLPQELIAQYPLEKRDLSRLLVYSGGEIREDRFRNLPALLPSDSMLVFNDSKVIRARFMFNKPSGASVEIFCLEPVEPTADLGRAFAAKDESHWKCYVGNLKKWKGGKLYTATKISDKQTEIWAEQIRLENDTVLVRFTWSRDDLSFSEIMEAAGHIPLPPYIQRNDDILDASRYQTIFAREPGSVAAPTAALHFTDTVLNNLKEKGISTQKLTLHVSAGTFKPVSSETIGGHDMHSEHYSVTRDFLERLLEHIGKQVIPVGTTSMRTLESLYWLGLKLKQNNLAPLITGQWEPYSEDHGDGMVQESLKAILNFMDTLDLETIHASTGLLIAPGYRFRICNGLVTNFHLPKSTLLLLVSALIGDDWKKAYNFAIERKFRFLSYGDSCLFLPSKA